MDVLYLCISYILSMKLFCFKFLDPMSNFWFSSNFHFFKFSHFSSISLKCIAKSTESSSNVLFFEFWHLLAFIQLNLLIVFLEKLVDSFVLPILKSLINIQVSGVRNLERNPGMYYFFIVSKLPAFATNHNASQFRMIMFMTFLNYWFKTIKIIVSQGIKLVKNERETFKFIWYSFE